MKCLFIGGTGTISEYCTRLAVEKNHEVYLLNRGNNNKRAPEGVKFIRADINNEAEAAAALEEYHFDAVVNFIAFTQDQIERDIRLFRDKTDQYIFISSASAYQKPVSDYMVTESCPLKNSYWEYSRNKIACEEALMKAYREIDFPFTVVRPSYTYGHRSIPFSITNWQSEWNLIDRILSGKEILVPGDGETLWVMTHSSDFAKGLVGLLGNVRAIGHAFHITSDEVLTWNEILDCIGNAVGVKPKPVKVPVDFICKTFPEQYAQLVGDKLNSIVFDTSKIKRFVPGYCATTSFAQGVRKSVEWFQRHPECCNYDSTWDEKCDKIIADYKEALK